MAAALAVGFLVGRWDQPQKPLPPADGPADYFVTTFNSAGQIVVTNTRSGDVFFAGKESDWKWQMLPPIPRVFRMPDVRIDSTMGNNFSAGPSPTFDPDAYLRSKRSPAPSATPTPH